MAKRQHKKKKNISVVRLGEQATPERQRQSGGVRTEVVDRDASGKAYITRHRAEMECVLDFYLRTQRISEQQHAAGMRFREIYLRVVNGANCKILGELFLINVGQGSYEGKMLAYIDCVQVLDNVSDDLSPAQVQVIRRVCGHDEYAGHDGQKKTLLRGLDALVEYWRKLDSKKG